MHNNGFILEALFMHTINSDYANPFIWEYRHLISFNYYLIQDGSSKI